MSNLQLEENLNQVKRKIEEACIRVNRKPDDVNIIVVTKYVDTDSTKQILDLGMEHIGENRVKQGIEKYEALHKRGIWHFIGNLQTRKVKEVIHQFDYFHSLDRYSLAKEMNKRAKQYNKKVKCFIQVNVSGEESKSGIEPEHLLGFVREIKDFDSIEIVGLMTMAPLTDDKSLIRNVFKELRNSLDLINHSRVLDYSVTELSMGMTNDYVIAIEEGATFVRLGTAIFS